MVLPALLSSTMALSLGSRPAPSMRCGDVTMAAGEKVVVTGVGAVSALGNTDEFWSGLIAGKSGIATIEGFDASRFPTTIGAECRQWQKRRTASRVTGCVMRALLGPDERGCLLTACCSRSTARHAPPSC